MTCCLIVFKFAELQVKFGGSWWTVDNYFKTENDNEIKFLKSDANVKHFLNNIIACFKMEEGHCIKDGIINYFNPGCYQNFER